jgi:Arc/MetJ-type ribon-helix-helix transcriptional regulator
MTRTRRINISIPDGLLDMIDDAAKKDFTNRSDIIRAAVLWYLRPQGRDFGQADPDEVLKTLQNRRLKAAAKKRLKKTGSI